MRACFCLLSVTLACLVHSLALQAQDMPISQLLIPGEDWQLIAEGYQFTEGPAVDEKGDVYFVDIPSSKILKIDVAAGKTGVFVEDSGKASGLMFGGDGRLYACQNGNRAIIAYDTAGKGTVICSDVDVNDLVVTRDNRIYWTDPKNKQVWFSDAAGKKRVVDQGIESPNGIILWADQRTLVVADSAGPHLWAFRIASDGSLEAKQPYYTMQMPLETKRSGADGMTVDQAGRLYVTTHVGLQVFDPSGRLSGVLAKPQPKFLSNVVFGGPKLDTLFVTSSDKVYARKVKAVGVRNVGPVVK